MPNFRIILAGALCLAACHETTPLARPTVDGARTMLFIGERDRKPLFAYAVSVVDGEPADIPALASRDGDVWWILGFSCPIDVLRLREEPLTLLDSEAALDALPIPPPTIVRRIEPATQETWTDVEAMSDVVMNTLLRLPVDATNRCDIVEPEFETEFASFSLPQQAIYYATSAAEQSNGTILVTTLQGPDFVFSSTIGSSIFELDLDRQTATEIQAGTGPFLAAHLDDAGDFWVITSSGIMHRPAGGAATLVQDFEGLGPVRFATIDGRGGGADLELSIVTTDRDGTMRDATRHWLHYDVGVLTNLMTRTRDTDIGLTRFLGPGHILAVRADDQADVVLEFVGGQVVRHTAPNNLEFVELEVDPSDGALLRTHEATVFAFAGGQFEPRFTGVPVITAWFPLLSGSLFIGSGINPERGSPSTSVARVAQFIEATGACEYRPFDQSSYVQRIVRLADGSVVTIEGSLDTRELRATRITLADQPPMCATQ